jgi:hypothetical protein
MISQNVAAIVSLGALVAAVVGGSWSLAQPGVPEGTFLRADDGAIYAVGSGTKIRLVAAADTANVLSRLRDGPTAANVGELNAALAAVRPTPLIANPVQPLIGQSARVCAESGISFLADVTDAAWQKNVTGRDARGNAMWAILHVTMTNMTSADVGPYRGVTPAIKLVDERNRNHEGNLGFDIFFDVQNDLAREHGLPTFSTALRPGIAEPRVIAFEVVPDVQRLTIASQASC